MNKRQKEHESDKYINESNIITLFANIIKAVRQVSENGITL